MDRLIKGCDSYGATVFPEPGEFRFIYFNNSLFYPPMQTNKSFPVQWRRAMDLGYDRGMYHMWRYYVDPVDHANSILDRMRGDFGELPVGLDFEDRYAVRGIRTVESIAKWGKVFTDAGIPIIIYTGTWWWDVWVTPYDSYFDQFGWSPYDYALWECDPDPDTVLPGGGKWEGKDVMRQYRLDTAYPGFNASIDIDYAKKEWYDRVRAKEEPINDLMTLTIQKVTAEDLRRALER